MQTRAAQISHLSSGIRTRPRDGRRILTLLTQTPPQELDSLVGIVDIGRVLRSLRNWRLGHRRQAVEFLLREQVAELSQEHLAQVVHAVHQGPTPRTSQEAIVEVLTSRTGEEFHDLKYRLNASGDYHDLEHLVFEDLDEDLADLVLEHIADQAAAVQVEDVRVLCDIDDTLKCFLHDKRYPRGTVYPGVVQLLHALDEGAAQEPGRPGDLTFVTARPNGVSGLIQQYTRNALSGLGLPPHSVMGGSVLNLTTKALIKDRKLENMERDRLLFPECRMVFIGVSGQADGAVGAEMYRRDPEHIVGTLLHNVSDLGEEQRQEWAAKGVHVFDTYAGAAVHAARLGLIRVDQAREVADEVRDGLDLLELTPGQRARLDSDLAREVAALDALPA